MLRLRLEGHAENTTPSLTLGEAPAVFVHDTRDADVDRPLNVAADELVRVHLIGTTAETSMIVMHAHAAALDRSALAMVAEELVEVASGTASEQASTDADVFAALAERRYDTEAAASISHRSFWTEMLLPWTPELKLGDRRRPVALAGLGRTQGDRMTANVELNLADVPVADRESLLLTAFGLALADVTGATGLLIERHVSPGAAHAGLAASLGADLPVPFWFEQDTSAMTHFERQRRLLKASESHRDFDAHSIERVMRSEMLKAGQRPAQAAFAYTIAGTIEPRLMSTGQHDIAGRNVEGGLAAKSGLLHDVTMNVTDTGAKTVVELAFDADVLDNATVLRLTQCLIDRAVELGGGDSALASSRKARGAPMSASLQ
jgi:hypothetical protein